MLGGQVISAWLCMSPCRSDHIFAAVSCSLRRMVSEDSRYRSCFVHPPIPSLPIHGECQSKQSCESCVRQVLPLIHRPNNLGKDEKIHLIRTYERLRSSEGA